MRSTLVSLVAVPALALAGTGLVAPAASAAPHPIIRTVHAFAAPAGDLGGISSPYVSCSDYTTQPTVTWVLTDLGTRTTRRWHWSGGEDGTYFPRVAAGRYRSRTVATCGATRSTRTQRVAVVQKTERTTVSRAEWHRIHRGMSPRRVARIVGYPGTAGVSVGATQWRFYDRMRFMKVAEIKYRHDRVVGRNWVAGGAG